MSLGAPQGTRARQTTPEAPWDVGIHGHAASGGSAASVLREEETLTKEDESIG